MPIIIKTEFFWRLQFNVFVNCTTLQHQQATNTVAACTHCTTTAQNSLGHQNDYTSFVTNPK